MDKKDEKVDWFTTLALIAALAMSSYSAYHTFKGRKGIDVPTISVVDIDRLNMAFVNETMAKNGENPELAAAELEMKSRLLLETVQKLRDEGKIVISRQAALTFPEGNDVTDIVAEKMGLNLPPQADEKPQVKTQMKLGGSHAGNPEID